MKLSLLVAHAESNTADFWQLLHAEHRYEIRTATSGVDCLTKLRLRKPDVLVLDHNLLWGGSDGVLARMREERFATQVPVVLIHNGTANEVPEFLKAPVACCVRRPCELSELMERIEFAAGSMTRCQDRPKLREQRSPELYPLGQSPPCC